MLAVPPVACSLPTPWPPTLMIDGTVKSLCWPRKPQGSPVSEFKAQSIPGSTPVVRWFAGCWDWAARIAGISPGSATRDSEAVPESQCPGF